MAPERRNYTIDDNVAKVEWEPEDAYIEELENGSILIHHYLAEVNFHEGCFVAFARAKPEDKVLAKMALEANKIAIPVTKLSIEDVMLLSDRQVVKFDCCLAGSILTLATNEKTRKSVAKRKFGRPAIPEDFLLSCFDKCFQKYGHTTDESETLYKLTKEYVMSEMDSLPKGGVLAQNLYIFDVMFCNAAQYKWLIPVVEEIRRKIIN
jgi:hypothetical protein